MIRWAQKEGGRRYRGIEQAPVLSNPRYWGLESAAILCTFCGSGVRNWVDDTKL